MNALTVERECSLCGWSEIWTTPYADMAAKVSEDSRREYREHLDLHEGGWAVGNRETIPGGCSCSWFPFSWFQGRLWTDGGCPVSGHAEQEGQSYPPALQQAVEELTGQLGSDWYRQGRPAGRGSAGPTPTQSRDQGAAIDRALAEVAERVRRGEKTW